MGFCDHMAAEVLESNLFHRSHTCLHVCHTQGEQGWLGGQCLHLRLLISIRSCSRDIKGAVLVQEWFKAGMWLHGLFQFIPWKWFQQRQLRWGSIFSISFAPSTLNDTAAILAADVEENSKSFSRCWCQNFAWCGFRNEAAKQAVRKQADV